ncbi:MAG TPA: hypothetical protein PLD59_09725 [Tepidisphaeraceae bacterium]|nr:hypothetical protein [Tepidisphaeraceae bacterium]
MENKDNNKPVELQLADLIADVVTDTRKRLGRIEKHLIDLKGNKPLPARD